MKFSKSKHSLVERRLKELEKEASLVKGDIKTLSKAIKKPDGSDVLSRLRSGRAPAAAIPAPMRRDPAAGATVARPAAPHDDAPLAPPAPASMPEKLASLLPPMHPAPETELKNKSVIKDERFASYFSSGSFMEARPLRQEKNVQRNKAIFMIVLVIIAAFTVFQLIFR